MSTEDNKAVARRYWEELHRGKGVGFGLEEDLFAPKYRHYLPGSSGPLDGKGHEHVSIAFYSGIPDAHVNVEDEIAEGDRGPNSSRSSGLNTVLCKPQLVVALPGQ